VDPQIRGQVDYVRKWLEFNIAKGPAITVVNKGLIMGAWGVRGVRPGVGSAWAVVCLKFGDVFGPDAAWTVRNMIEMTAAEYGFKRIRAHSRKGFAASQRLLRHLGFERMRRETETHLFYRKQFLATVVRQAHYIGHRSPELVEGRAQRKKDNSK